MIKVPINIPTFKRSKRNKKADPDKWYIYKTKLMLAAIFFKTAGGVGRIILEQENGKATKVKLNIEENLNG